MIKKTITYTDFNGEQQTEDLYFHLSKAEILEMELTMEGGLKGTLEGMVNAKDVPSMVNMFKEVIAKSYGVKSEDGKRFIKTKELAEEFLQSEAYSELFVELLSNEDAPADFINGVMPANLSNQ